MGGKDGRRLIEPRKRGKRGRVGVSVVIDENNVCPHLKMATQFARPRPCTSCCSWLKRRAHCKGKRIANAVLERKEQKRKKREKKDRNVQFVPTYTQSGERQNSCVWCVRHRAGPQSLHWSVTRSFALTLCRHTLPCCIFALHTLRAQCYHYYHTHLQMKQLLYYMCCFLLYWH